MLELNGLYKVFNAGTVNEKRAIDGLDLTLEEGDFVTVIGGNGAGKSTTLKAVCGICRPYRGKIAVFGKNVEKWRGHHAASRAQTGQISGPGVPGPDDGNRSHHGH